MSRIRVIGRWSVVVGSTVALACLSSFESSGDDREGRGTVLLVTQKPQPKKKASATKKVAAAPADGEGMMGATPKADSTSGTAEGSLSFKRDIAPLLVANCVGCHTGNGAGLTRGKLDMSNFDKLMAGGKRGADIIPGDADSSHLVLMIKGEETPKMPPNNGQRGFSEAAQGKIEAWVKAGARLDAGLASTDAFNKYAPTTTDLRRDELSKMKPEERDKIAEQTGRDRWKKATATVPDFTTGTHFLGFGNLPGDRMTKLLKAMEAQYTLANRLLGTTRAPALDSTEKINLYVFKDLNTFVEFVRSNENQEVEPGEMARARLNVESPYIVAVDPANGGEEATPTPAKKSARKSKKSEESLGGPERSLLGLMTEQLMVGSANRAGKPPKWVSFGLGAYAASKVEGGSPYYRRLRNEALSEVQIGWALKATEVLGGGAPADTTRAVGFGLFEWIAANAPGQSMNAFLKIMLEGQEKLDEATIGCFELNREQFLAGSGNWIAEKYGH